MNRKLGCGLPCARAKRLAYQCHLEQSDLSAADLSAADVSAADLFKATVWEPVCWTSACDAAVMLQSVASQRVIYWGVWDAARPGSTLRMGVAFS